MRFGDLFKMSISSLFKRKVRTVLTVLGVVIGTISIVVMVSLGIGLKASIMSQITMFSDIQKIDVSLDSFSNSSDKDSEKKRLDDALVEELSKLEHVEMVCPRLNSDAIIKYQRYYAYIDLVGMTEEEMNRINLDVGRGHIPTDDKELELFFGNIVITRFNDEKTSSNPYYEKGEVIDVDLMDDSIFLILDTDSYFAGRSGVSDGTTKKAKKHILKTAGVMAGDENTYSSGYCYNTICNIDALKTALQKEYKGRKIPGQPVNKKGKPYKEIFYSTISVYVDEMENVSGVQQIISDMGYQAYSEASFIEMEMQSINLIEIVLGGIGAVSLVVAAIGIANTMMMSIYERTKEIGVMKVIGCKISDIQMMFLFESGLIGLFGGIVGLLISYGASALINFLVGASGEMFEAGTKISIIPFWLALAAMIFSIFVGMMAGFFPSRRAMKLSPLAAIRNE